MNITVGSAEMGLVTNLQELGGVQRRGPVGINSDLFLRLKVLSLLPPFSVAPPPRGAECEYHVLKGWYYKRLVHIRRWFQIEGQGHFRAHYWYRKFYDQAVYFAAFLDDEKTWEEGALRYDAFMGFFLIEERGEHHKMRGYGEVERKSVQHGAWLINQDVWSPSAGPLMRFPAPALSPPF